MVGWDGAAFGGEIGGERVVGQGAEAGDDTLGVELGSGEGGVGVRIAEEGIDGSGAEGVVAAGNDLVEIHEADVLCGGDLLGPAAIGGAVADDVAIEPELAGDERAEDGSGALGAGVGDVFAQVPAEGVDGFVGVGDRVLDVEGLVANAGEAAATGLRAGSCSGRWCRRGLAGKQAWSGTGGTPGRLTPPSLWPNWMRTKSPGLMSSRVESQCPCEM